MKLVIILARCSFSATDYSVGGSEILFLLTMSVLISRVKDISSLKISFYRLVGCHRAPLVTHII
jgi:hypothetical protein